MGEPYLDPAMTEPRFERKRFSFPRLGGLEQLRDLVAAYGGPANVCRDLLVSGELLDAYLAGTVEAPLTFYLALHWQGPDGFHQAFGETHWTHQAMVARVKLAEARLLQHQLLLQAVAPQVRGMIVLAKTYGIEDGWLVDWAARLKVEAIRGDGAQPHGKVSSRHVPG